MKLLNFSFMSTENQYHNQAPGWFSLSRGNRDTATAVLDLVWDEALGKVRSVRYARGIAVCMERVQRAAVHRARYTFVVAPRTAVAL